jgi:hypothetical protein
LVLGRIIGMFLSYAVMLNSGLLNEFIQAVIPLEAAA